MNHTEFIECVAARPTVPPTQAETITRATLETLAERLSGGQARDLAARLPEELRGHLGKPSEQAEPFGVDDFVERVGARAAVDPRRAMDGARAVLDTLRQAAGGKEYGDVVAQLPQEFWQLTGPAATRLETRHVGT